MLCCALFQKHDIIRQSIYTWLWFFPLWLNLSPQPLPMLTHRLLAATTVYACNECREIFKHKQLSVNKVLHCHIYIHLYTIFCFVLYNGQCKFPKNHNDAIEQLAFKENFKYFQLHFKYFHIAVSFYVLLKIVDFKIKFLV